MKFNIFKKDKKPDLKAEPEAQEEVTANPTAAPTPIGVSQGAHEIIRSFYVSEKASRLMGMNQYVFKVAKSADSQSVKRHISKLYKVKVERVQMLNMPAKNRNVGKHPGTKSGFRKAIVTLAEGNTIEQAKP